MSYLSLYRKWRPQTFEEVVGQVHVVRTLRNALSTGRTCHAYLFCGPRGTGKTTTARLLAKGLNCEMGPTADPCNACDSCRRIAEGHALDVIEVDGASNRGIDEIRELREKVRFAPAQARQKVYIIDEVHMLTTEAFNALLKVLEEPPSHVVFIFATTEAHKIPATILSRCQRFDLKPLTSVQVVERLAFVAEHEGVKIEPGALALIARHAAGGMRDALAILDQCIAFGADAPISESLVGEVLGVAPGEQIEAFANTLQVKDAVAGLLQIQKLVDAGKDLRQFARDVIGHLRDIMLQLATGTTQADRTVGSWNLPSLLSAIDALAAAEGEMRYSTEARMAMEIAFLKLTSLSRSEGPSSVEAEAGTVEAVAASSLGSSLGNSIGAGAADSESRLVRLEQQFLQITHSIAALRLARIAPVEPVAPPPLAPVANANDGQVGQPKQSTLKNESSVGLEAVQTAWQRLLERLKEQRQFRVEAILKEGRPAKIVGDLLTVEFPEGKAYHQEQMADDRVRIPAEQALEHLFGRRLRVVARGVGDSSTDRQPDPPPASKSGQGHLVDVDDRLLDEPVLQAALRLFNGIIVKVEPTSKEEFN